MQYFNTSHSEIIEIAKLGNSTYLSAEPFPNIVFDNLFSVAKLEQVIAELPDLRFRQNTSKFSDQNQLKLATKGESMLGDETRAFIYYLNSGLFLDFLSTLTGIRHLIPDPYLKGGGYHQINRGGHLKIHADFNFHPLYKLDRRLNVLIYLNKDWKEEYGGHFELWDKKMMGSVKKILPVFNRMAIFSTTSTSYHGHPEPLNCPEDRSRQSIAMYYYTNGRPENEMYQRHSTLFQKRPGTTDGNT